MSFEKSEIFLTNPRISLEDFYEKSTILITGGTGFLGKVLITKLLCTFNIRRIYLLIREKDKKTADQRLQEFFKESVFNEINEQNKQLLQKIHVINVNYEVFNLGLSEINRQTLCNEVQIVFNVVASVKFNERLSDAIKINVLGTKKTLELAMQFKNLKAFLHISTLYSNCNRKFIKEKVYELAIGYTRILQHCRTLDNEAFENERQELMGDMPNTYTMTKNCAENLVNHRGLFMAAGIFRPPIVISTYKQPFQGWTDNLYGPSGLCTYTAMGMIRCILGRASCKANLVPADYCVNAMIASAWDVARRFKNENQLGCTRKFELPVYNFISNANNITWGEYMKLARVGFHKPFSKGVWCFAYIIVPWKPIFNTLSFFLHGIPAYLMDFICWTMKKTTKHRKNYRKLSRLLQMMSWFGLKEWNFSHDNIDNLQNMLTAREKNLLEFNIATIDWRDYFVHYLSGVRHYIFHENDVNINRKRYIYRSMLLMHNLMKLILGYKFIKFVFSILCIVRKKLTCNK